MWKHLAVVNKDLRQHLPASGTGISSAQLVRYKAYLNIKTDNVECFLNPSNFKHTLVCTAFQLNQLQAGSKGGGRESLCSLGEETALKQGWEGLSKPTEVWGWDPSPPAMYGSSVPHFWHSRSGVIE